MRSQSDLPEKSALQKERILNAASDVFLATGFEKTSTAEIARLAKVSKRELYLHFSDKRSLLAAVVKDLQSDIGGRMDSLWASTQPMEDVLLNSAKIIQGFILSERFGKLIRIVAAEAYHSPKIATQFFEMGPSAGRGATARYLKQQMKQGNLRKADPMKAADDFLDLVVGCAVAYGRHSWADGSHHSEAFRHPTCRGSLPDDLQPGRASAKGKAALAIDQVEPEELFAQGEDP